MNSSAAWILDEGGSAEPGGSPRQIDDARSLLRDLRDVTRRAGVSFEKTREFVEATILRHTGADAAGAVLFEERGYRAARDCPVIAALPDLEHPLRRALGNCEPLAANSDPAEPVCSFLMSPIVIDDQSIGMLWAVGRFERSSTGRDLEMLGCLADIVAISQTQQRAVADDHDELRKAAGFRALIQNVQDYAIFTVDPRGIVTDWTEGAHRVLGYPAEEAIGRDFKMFFTEEDVQAGEPQKELDQATVEGRAERESWRVHRSGDKIWVNAISSAVRDEHGSLVGFIKVSRDLTERRRIELELRHAHRVADQANQAKSRFLATASHDLRQPLQSLSLLSGTLRRMATNPYLLDAVEQQELAIASMSGLLNALLDISKLDSGSVKPARQHIALGPIMEQMRIEFAASAAKKGLDLEIPACEVFVHTDPILFGQILRNLVSNALRYTPSGSVTLCVSVREETVDIEVRDTGIGIAEAHLERIFEEFYQVDVRPNSVREGHGLGLSIVRRTAGILGHALSVSSVPGAGSCFRISVPLGQVTMGSAEEDATLQMASGKAPHVLLIDDDPGVLKATRLLLEVEGYRVTVGRTVADAQAAAAQHHDLQLLISDYHLADGESGSRVIRILREALPHIEVIMMTGDTSSGLRHFSPADGICVASKPIEADALLGMMKRLLAHQG